MFISGEKILAFISGELIIEMENLTGQGLYTYKEDIYRCQKEDSASMEDSTFRKH